MSGWVGLDEVMQRLTVMAESASHAARTVVVGSAAIVEANAKRQFAGSHRKGQPHVGGSRPNVVTGTLRRSIVADAVEPLGLGVWHTRVGPTAIYGRRIELMGFPYFGPGVEQSRPQIGAYSLAIWKRVSSTTG